jgi:two-component system response regulator RegA
MTAAGAPSVSASASVLVVDDDETFRGRLVRAFQAREFEAQGAKDGESAIALAKKESPEYAVVDLRMPGISGLDVVRELKAIDAMTNIVVLTGYGSIATALEAVRLGATHYLTKPADVDDLLAAFERAKRPPGDPLPPAALETMNVPSLARRVGAHQPGADRLRRQHFAGRALARASSPEPAAEALEVPEHSLIQIGHPPPPRRYDAGRISNGGLD